MTQEADSSRLMPTDADHRRSEGVVESRGVEPLTGSARDAGANDGTGISVGVGQRPRQQSSLPTSDDGRWVVSDGGEHWSLNETFATKEEAVAYAQENDGTHVGRLHELTAARAFSQDRLQSLLEEIDEEAGEDWGADDSIVDLQTKDAEALRLDIAAAMEKHGTFASWFRIDCVEAVPDAEEV